VGHMGICDSRGICLDFIGAINVDDLAFGRTTRRDAVHVACVRVCFPRRLIVGPRYLTLSPKFIKLRPRTLDGAWVTGPVASVTREIPLRRISG
jgi:hypothetical protein